MSETYSIALRARGNGNVENGVDVGFALGYGDRM
jgi:hypothetical protein